MLKLLYPSFYCEHYLLLRSVTWVFMLDGCSVYYAHLWSKVCIWICERHLVTSKESSNPKISNLHHTCAACSELPSYISTMIGNVYIWPVYKCLYDLLSISYNLHIWNSFALSFSVYLCLSLSIWLFIYVRLSLFRLSLYDLSISFPFYSPFSC